jgi:hypothetical protein
MNEIQQKIDQALKLLIEVRLMARRQGEIYRSDHNLPIARYYEQLDNSLADNVSCTISSLSRHLEGNPPVKNWSSPISQDDILKEAEHIYRFINSKISMEARNDSKTG